MDTSRPTTAPNASAAAQAPSLAHTRAALQALLALAIILPLTFFVGYAWKSYSDAGESVRQHVGRLGHVAEEHALKVFEINDQINNRVLDLIKGKSDEQIRREEGDYHAALSRIAADIPQLSSLNVFSRTGAMLVSNRFYPVPAELSIADREDFLYHKDNRGPVHVSPVFTGRALGQPVFNVSIARRDEKLGFLGMVSAALRPAYFADYYKYLAEREEGVAITLIHGEGSVIARYPAPPEGFSRLNPEGPIMRQIRAGQSAGTADFISSVDGLERYAAFRQIGAYPVYLATSYSRQAWLADWYAQIAVVAGFTFVPSLALCVLLLIALRRLQREEEGWNQWRAEVTQRQATEIAYKQARRLEALGQLTGSVAHDFNNLLMVVSTSTMLLRRRLVGREDVEQPLGALERSLEAGKRLTRQLLAFSRKQPLRPEVLDVPAQMNEFMELVRASIGSRVRLEMDVDSATRPVFVDPGEFELAMLNLAINARDAMPEGGKLIVRTRNVTLDGSGETNLYGEFIAISFEDSGHGISDDDLKRVFEPFFTTKAPGRGTGLGLAQVYGFCEQAGGAATVESAVGSGTTVTLFLPVSEQPYTHAPATRDEVEAQHAKGRVLLVEDNPEVAQATRIVLEQIGYAAELAHSGEEAMARIDSNGVHWDIVVSDVLMPGRTSGIALAKWLQTHYPDLPVLLITGYTAQLEQAKSEGLQVLAKPFNVQSLRRAMDALRPQSSDGGSVRSRGMSIPGEDGSQSGSARHGFDNV
ncbi:MAG TPA: ATP-binding protein [Burkholderiales bacterium]